MGEPVLDGKVCIGVIRLADTDARHRNGTGHQSETVSAEDLNLVADVQRVKNVAPALDER